MATTTIRRWGNSQGLYIPKDLLKLLGVAVNEQVTLSFENGAIMIRPDAAGAGKAAAFDSLQKIREEALARRSADETDAVRDHKKEYLEYLDERYNR